jgi:preprotein translocase subunit SecF
MISSGLVSLILNKGPNLSIDFTGGTIIQILFNNDLKIDELRSALQSTELSKSEITQFGQNNEYRIKASISDKSQSISDILSNNLSMYDYEVRRIENVGPKIGNELQLQAIYAIGLALVMLMIYIGFRFDRFYSFGSVAAIFHDILFTLGIFSLLNLEIDLSIIAAFLTIVGYSLNDTIVIFDRFRENSQKDLKISMEEIANLSLNQTLSRTIITSLTTLLVVIILYFIGGEVIRYFAFALIIGVLVGTYSSIFIASPFMLYLKSKVKIEEEE